MTLSNDERIEEFWLVRSPSFHLVRGIVSRGFQLNNVIRLWFRGVSSLITLLAQISREIMLY